MKYLGIDYGTKKVGLAISDEGASFAFPKEIVSIEKALERIVELTEEEKVGGIVLGHSIASNGEKNEIASFVESFTEKLQSKISVPIFFEREDFSSVEAHRYQTKAGDRDDSAAAIILQRYLDKLLDNKNMQQ